MNEFDNKDDLNINESEEVKAENSGLTEGTNTAEEKTEDINGGDENSVADDAGKTDTNEASDDSSATDEAADSDDDDDDRPPLTDDELVLREDFESVDLLGLETEQRAETESEEENTLTDVSEPMWYTVHVYTGKENEVKDKVLELKNDKEVGEYIKDVFIPTEVVLVKANSNTKARKNSYPGYIFVKARITNTSWYRIRNIEHVVGFAGQGSNPTPLTPEEIRRLDIEKVEILYDFNVGDDIKIIRGSFDTFTGKVTEVMHDKEKVKARVLMFGRETEIELSYDDIDKL